MKKEAREAKINPYGWAGIYISYTNIYHACLVKLLHECSEAMGSCDGCPVAEECNKCFDVVSDFKTQHACGIGVTSETFLMLVLQFSKFRDKAQEKAHQITKNNHKEYVASMARS